MRRATILALLIGCAAEVPQECAPDGEHELVFEELAGDCGPMAPERVDLGADGPDDARGSWCELDLSPHPEEVCGVGASVECDELELVFAVAYAGDGLSGWAEVRRLDADGSTACEGSYAVTATPLDP